MRFVRNGKNEAFNTKIVRDVLSIKWSSLADGSGLSSIPYTAR